MIATFNALLARHGIDPGEVSLLRHQADKGAPGRTPYTLWQDDLARFELCQSTQRADQPVFRNARDWASFVSPAPWETLFVGLYEVEWAAGQAADWLDPLTDQAVGAGKPHPPVRNGLRLTRAEELEIVCPTCHRKAHRKSRLQPFTLTELRAWADAGRTG